MNKIFLASFLVFAFLSHVVIFTNYQTADAQYTEKLMVDYSELDSRTYTCGDLRCFEFKLYLVQDEVTTINANVFLVEYRTPISYDFTQASATFLPGENLVVAKFGNHVDAVRLVSFPSNSNYEFVGGASALFFDPTEVEDRELTIDWENDNTLKFYPGQGITFRGTANPGEKLNIAVFADGNNKLGMFAAHTVFADDDGNWVTTIFPITPNRYELVVESNDDIIGRNIFHVDSDTEHIFVAELPDGTKITTKPTGSIVTEYLDGTIVYDFEGKTTTHFPDKTVKVTDSDSIKVTYSTTLPTDSQTPYDVEPDIDYGYIDPDYNYMNSKPIPKWITKTASDWADGNLPDYGLLEAVQYLLQNRILEYPELTVDYSSTDVPDYSIITTDVPDWIKWNIKNWATDHGPSHEDFLHSVAYLLANGYIESPFLTTTQEPDLPPDPFAYSKDIEIQDPFAYDDTDDANESVPKTVLPPQQKQVFQWWADGFVSDEEMMNSITYMFEAKIITSDKIEITESEFDELGPIKKSTFPPQQKQVLQWWAEGLVSDEEVMNNITYLFETKTLQSGKIKIKNDGLAKITQNDPYGGLAKVTPIDPSTINPYDDLPFAKVTQNDPNDGLAKVVPIDPTSDEWVDFEKDIIKRTYESQKWHEAIAKKLVGIKDSQAKVLDDAQRQITSIYAQDGNPAAIDELVEIKDAVKKVDDEALQAVKFLSKTKELIEKTESIAKDAGIHTSELADAVSEQQEMIDSVIPELGTVSDFKDAYDDIDKTMTSAFSDLQIEKLLFLGGKSRQDITEEETKIMFRYSFETEGEIETVARMMLASPGYKDMPYYEILETLRGHELEQIVKDEKFREVYDELKTKNQKTFADSESVVDELGGIIIDYGSPYGYDPKTGKPYDPPPKKPVLILREYKLNDVENEKVLDVLTPGFLDSFKIDPLTSDEPRTAQDLDVDEELIEDVTNSQNDEPLQETTPAPPQEPVTGDAALYRLVSEYDHFYTTDVNEKNNAYGYAFERIEAYIFSTQEPGTVPLYRLFNGIDHFYLIDSAERSTAISHYGYVDEGIEGYVYVTQEPGTVPLYRLVSGTNHFYTTDMTEKNNAVAYLNYIDEGIECYVFPNE